MCRCNNELHGSTIALDSIRESRHQDLSDETTDNPPISNNQLKHLQEEIGGMGTRCHRGVNGEMMTGCVALNKIALDQLGVPPEHHQAVIELHTFCQQWRSGMQLDSYKQPPYTSNWIQYGNNIERMPTLRADNFVSTIKSLTRFAHDYTFPMRDFKAINTKYNANTLRLPGVGLRILQQSGQCLFHILQHILPQTAELQSQIDVVTAGDDNGYTLLWNNGQKITKIYGIYTNVNTTDCMLVQVSVLVRKKITCKKKSQERECTKNLE